jgi:hypothetical protein
MSRIWNRYLAVLLLLIGASVPALSQDRPSVFQSWNEVQFIVPLVRSEDANGKTVNRVTAIFNGIGRFGRGQLVDGRIGVELNFRVNKYVTLVGSALYRGDEVVRNVRHGETRLAAGATLSLLLRKFSIRDRNLIEHRVRIDRGDINVWRHRLQISHPVTQNGKTLFSPFLSEELFYDAHARRFNNNELFLGITRQLTKRSALDIAYIRNDTAPANVNGISLALKITLR